MEMNSCVVLGDKAVHKILIELSRDKILAFLDRVAASLTAFSTADERQYQPDSSTINRAEGRKILFRPFTSPTSVGVKIIVDPSQALANDVKNADKNVDKSKLSGLHGILALCDENGLPKGMLNAEEITGYRTSLSAMILYVKRKKTANLVVFGGGKQALWHIRLALALRGDEIQRVTVINRSATRAQSLLDQIREENSQRWKSDAELLTVSSEDELQVAQILAQADAIFCTTPSQRPLFPARHLSHNNKCYISAIGSWQATMVELDPEIVINAADGNAMDSMLVVDDREACLKHTGEIVQSKLHAEKLAELGEVLHMLSTDEGEVREQTAACLTSGFVVYKSVGVSLTDLAAGEAILDLARKQQAGTHIADF